MSKNTTFWKNIKLLLSGNESFLLFFRFHFSLLDMEFRLIRFLLDERNSNWCQGKTYESDFYVRIIYKILTYNFSTVKTTSVGFWKTFTTEKEEEALVSLGSGRLCPSRLSILTGRCLIFEKLLILKTSSYYILRVNL